MAIKKIDFIGGTCFQLVCLGLLLSGFPHWIVLLSIFGGMWTVGIWRGCFDWVRKKVIQIQSSKEQEPQK
jgi:hypothetical protein